jgi:pimeloyl-ACP methyl ester carboxylesterase
MAMKPIHALRHFLPLIVLCAAVSPAAAQDAEDPPKKPKGPPNPVTVDLTTKDYLQMKVEYYGGFKGKETPPVVIIHDLKGNRNEFGSLALYLQKLGYAVIVPDLRGHGGSTVFRAPNGQTAEIDSSRLRQRDFANMVNYDLEAVRKFIKQKNNEGELNLNAMSVIGSGVGAVLGLNWTAKDWSAPPLATGKQGQDVKALVLVSPTWNVQGLGIENALKQPGVQKSVSMLILVGKGRSSELKEAKRLHNTLEGARPGQAPEAQNRDLFIGEVATPLQGTKLLMGPSFKLNGTIAKFLQWRVVDQDCPWGERATVGE